ncbi:TOBE domain-containing protein, partial [Halorubrum sp. SS7]
LEGDRLVGEVFEYSIDESVQSDLGGVTDLRLGIRPEAVELVDEGGEHAFETTVDVVEPMGDENTVYLHF